MANYKSEHTFLFTGHMIDKPGRERPRFPASREGQVRSRIKENVRERQELLGPDAVLTGISGGACGGDILFHEVCGELGIPTVMYLALPREEFIGESVVFAGLEWVERFDRLFEKLPHLLLSEQQGLPGWVSDPNHDVWTRNNLWNLHGALSHGGPNMTLFALWDGKGGDGPGGTAHMVEVAVGQGATVIVIGMDGA